MPIFSTRVKEMPYRWNYEMTRMATSTDPSFAQLETIANAELNKVNDFVSYKDMQNTQDKADLAKLSRYNDRVTLPSIRQKIATDHSLNASMNKFTGMDWPSLRHDFGVVISETDARSAEFRINFETENATGFPTFEPLYKHFEKLGLEPDNFQEMIVDMSLTERDLADRGKNPHPKNKIGREMKVDFEGSHLRIRNLFRYRYQYNFNKLADENGTYVHIRFESQNQYARDRSAFNQNLVFIFPTSNEEREIWRHVFWGEEYPAAGFPVQTEYARKLNELQGHASNSSYNVGNMASDFSRISVEAAAQPPSHNSTWA